MAEGESPTVARRRVRLALREAREAIGYTQQEVADEMEWSLSKVIRIENGDVSIAPNDLRPLLGFLKIKDKARVTELVEAAKVARTRQRQAWYQTPDFREYLSDPLRKLIEFEGEANWIHNYSVFHLPGLLQIPEYSSALIYPWSEELTPEQIEYRLTARRLRHEAVLARADSLKMTALLDESVFYRPIGGPAVLSAQLAEVLRMTDIGLLSVRVIKFTADVPMSYNAGFDLIFLGEDGDVANAVMYRETGTQDEILEDLTISRTNATGPPPPGPVARHYDRYLKLWKVADSEDDTIDFIRRRIHELG